jgi:3-phenylpropionate/trans-cinnamate dioxygenase ferredoxin reductase subunit
MTGQNMLIIGAGQAGAMAAKALRDFGYAGSISIVGKELHFPYERPPLSKAMLQMGIEPLTEILSDETCQKLNIEVRRGLDVVAIDAGARTAQLESGEVMGFDRCLLATGGSPREHPLFPAGLDGVHYIRTLDDARRLREELGSVSRMAVIGGGFLGLEIACAWCLCDRAGECPGASQALPSARGIGLAGLLASIKWCRAPSWERRRCGPKVGKPGLQAVLERWRFD